MAVEQSVTVYRGEAAKLNFTAATGPTPITGWTIKFTLSKKKNDVTKLIGPIPVTVVDAATGVYKVLLAEEDTDRKPAEYFFDVWRTDEGFEEVLALGPFIILGDARVPPIEP